MGAVDFYSDSKYLDYAVNQSSADATLQQAQETPTMSTTTATTTGAPLDYPDYGDWSRDTFGDGVDYYDKREQR